MVLFSMSFPSRPGLGAGSVTQPSCTTSELKIKTTLKACDNQSFSWVTGLSPLVEAVQLRIEQLEVKGPVATSGIRPNIDGRE